MSEYRKGTTRVGAKGDKEPPGAGEPLCPATGYPTDYTCPLCGSPLLTDGHQVWCAKVGSYRSRAACPYGVRDVVRVEDVAAEAAEAAEAARQRRERRRN